MTKHALGLTAALLACLTLAYLFGQRYERYAMQGHEQALYKLDRLTGAVTLITPHGERDLHKHVLFTDYIDSAKLMDVEQWEREIAYHELGTKDQTRRLVEFFNRNVTRSFFSLPGRVQDELRTQFVTQYLPRGPWLEPVPVAILSNGQKVYRAKDIFTEEDNLRYEMENKLKP
ncbi:hypothetical protein [Desulfocurvibacter africanus]|uniref:Uncharacterized protein n=1 Tax=Desulfocurvibacter africanus subsp. africanus str. Walvis Bay TaxID=690850 RepID=F3YXE2_DESAF|nr:hypothetical protein [Desulfocurvibacter africanus]EGJ51719.1 hypothetical protein Desaf_3433 [Desulfocurvibacter africanus subsp. africanus str. Walvis Bay]